MRMLLGDLGPTEGLRAAAKAEGGAHIARRRKPAAGGEPHELATVEARSFTDRPPRSAATSSEVAILDAVGRIVVVNQAWRDSFAAYGFDLPNGGIGALYADVAYRCLPNLDRAGLERTLGRLQSREIDDFRRTFSIQTAVGPRWRHVQITPLSVGTAGRFVAIHDDQTELALTQEALQATLEQILTARDEERQRIAIELHDSTGQHLAAINLGLSALRRASPKDGPGAAIIDEIAKSLNEAVKETRALSYLMKPRAVTQDGLSATLRKFLDGFAKRTGLEITLQSRSAVDYMPPPLQHAALRIIQEALLNAHRHAQARRVRVELAIDGAELTVSVSDDGHGMTLDHGEPSLGVGIPGMQARTQQVAGHLAISSDESGTRIVATLPLD